MHPLESASNFNESMYFNVYDPSERVGGFLRLGNRANEGYAEMTTCLYLPDGRVGFMYARPEIANNDAFDAGGMSFEVITPFEELKTTYTGKVCILDEPLQMANPRKAFTENPWVDCEVILDHRGIVADVRRRARERRRLPAHRGPLRRLRPRPLRAAHRRPRRDPRRRRGVGGRRLRPARPLVGPALLAGAVVVPLAHHELRRRRGLRGLDHHVTRRQAARRRHGARERRVPPPRPRRRSRPTGSATTPTTRRCASPRGSGDREYEITGSVLNLIPLRNRRTTPEGEQLVTRISEGMTEWKWDGRTGYGLSEYLDQIIDGKPVGAERRTGSACVATLSYVHEHRVRRGKRTRCVDHRGRRRLVPGPPRLAFPPSRSSCSSRTSCGRRRTWAHVSAGSR